MSQLSAVSCSGSELIGVSSTFSHSLNYDLRFQIGAAEKNRSRDVRI